MSALSVTDNHLPYVSRLASRFTEHIDLIVLHCTELPDFAMARIYGERIHYPESGTGNAGHFYIGRDGRTEQWVPVDRVAHHVRDFNERSIGIELVNRGRYPDWFNSNNQEMSETYTHRQLSSLVALLNQLSNDLSALRWICGHEDLDDSMVAASDDPGQLVRRKRDPGPCFPWHQVLEQLSLTRFIGQAG